MQWMVQPRTPPYSLCSGYTCKCSTDSRKFSGDCQVKYKPMCELHFVCVIAEIRRIYNGTGEDGETWHHFHDWRTNWLVFWHGSSASKKWFCAYLCRPHTPQWSGMQREIHPPIGWTDSWFPCRCPGLRKTWCKQRFLADSPVSQVSEIYNFHNPFWTLLLPQIALQQSISPQASWTSSRQQESWTWRNVN